MNPSFYQNFNYNFGGAKNQSITEIGGKVNLKWFESSVFANYFRIDNFAYFGTDFLPKQSSETVNISQIGGEATLNYWKLKFTAKESHLYVKYFFVKILIYIFLRYIVGGGEVNIKKARVKNSR